MVIVESWFRAAISMGLLSSGEGDGLTSTRLAFPNTSWTTVLAVVLVTVVHDSLRTCSAKSSRDCLRISGWSKWREETAGRDVSN